MVDLQTTYQNYKSTLQTIASKIGDIEQETEEHKYARPSPTFAWILQIPPLASYTAIFLESSLQ